MLIRLKSFQGDGLMSTVMTAVELKAQPFNIGFPIQYSFHGTVEESHPVGSCWYGKFRFPTKSGLSHFLPTDWKFKRTWTIQIDVGKVQGDYWYFKPLRGFSSCSYRDFAEAGVEALDALCRDKGWRIIQITNHWPTLVAIVESQQS